MTQPFHPDDRPDPAEQPIRARVPDHVSGGAFSTGVIVMTAHSEFILDFVQNLGRPHQIVARVIMPHHVLPQLVDALSRNIDLYKSRWGELPQLGSPLPPATTSQDVGAGIPTPDVPAPGGSASEQLNASSGGVANDSAPESANPTPGPSGGAGGSPSGGSGPLNPQADASDSAGDSGETPPEKNAASEPSGQMSKSGARQASAQDIYDDLKIRDELLSGSYANAVMIGHGPHEFSFDFITNFYPNSCVSSRVFLAAGQVPRLFDSLKGTWDQLRNRMQPPGGPQPPDGGYPGGDDENGPA